jgi:hypothetical protein
VVVGAVRQTVGADAVSGTCTANDANPTATSDDQQDGRFDTDMYKYDMRGACACVCVCVCVCVFLLVQTSAVW